MSEPVPDEALRRRNRRNLVLMVVIAVVPLALAYAILYLFPQLIPRATTNKGTLISPPVLAGTLFTGAGSSHKWTLLLSAGTDCGDRCQHALYLARQVNIALGKDSNRVQRVLLVSGARLSPAFNKLVTSQYPHMQVQFLAPGAVQDRLGRFSANGNLDGYVFMADPAGNIMMYYSPSNAGKDILADLKHLLGVTG